MYKRQNIKTPVKIGVVTLIATQLMNVLFIFGLQLQHAGLALSIGLGACLNSAILFYLLRKHGIYQPESGWRLYFGKIGLAMLALALELYFGMGSQQSWLESHGWPRVGRLTLLVAGGVCVYFLVLWLLGFRPRHFSRRAVS